MLGPIIIWYLAGIVMIAIYALEFALERSSERKRVGSTRSQARGSATQPLFYVTVIGALAIFAVWPWVALTLARNATL